MIYKLCNNRYFTCLNVFYHFILHYLFICSTNSSHVGFPSIITKKLHSSWASWFSLVVKWASHANFTWFSTLTRVEVIYSISVKLLTQKHLSNLDNKLSTTSALIFPWKIGISKFAYTLSGVWPQNFGFLGLTYASHFPSISKNCFIISSRFLFNASSINVSRDSYISSICFFSIFDHVHLKGR